MPSKAPVLVPFVCPACAGANAVELVALSRAGGVECAKCTRYLRSAEVMRAMHAPRDAHAHEKRRERAPRATHAAMVWPPTPESRAAIARRAARAAEPKR